MLLDGEAGATLNAAASQNFLTGAACVALPEAVFFLTLAPVWLMGSFGHMEFL